MRSCKNPTWFISFIEMLQTRKLGLSKNEKFVLLMLIVRNQFDILKREKVEHTSIVLAANRTLHSKSGMFGVWVVQSKRYHCIV